MRFKDILRMNVNLFNYKNCLMTGIGLAAITFLLFVSFISFSQFDNSFFSYSENKLYHNLLGFVGANLAALFFFFLGSISSFIFLGTLAYTSFFLIKKLLFVSEWERSLAFFVNIFSCSALCNYYQIDFFNGVFAGGWIGNSIVSFLLQTFDPVISVLFLWSVFIASSILILRTLFVYKIYLIAFVGKFLTSEKFLRPAGASMVFVAKMIFVPLKYSFAWTKELISGADLKESGKSVFEFEKGEVDLKEIQEEFWKSLLVEKTEIDIDQEKISLDNAFNLDTLELDGGAKSCTDAECESMKQDVISERKHGAIKEKKYELPKMDIFTNMDVDIDHEKFEKDLELRARVLEEKLEKFGVLGKVTAIKSGPVVTLFEYEPEIDTKISKITSLEDDLALALQALSIRIIAPIPGRSLVGFEVANQKRKDVCFAKVVRSEKFKKFSGSLPLVLGNDITGNDVVVDLAKMPHLLIAGSTGSGKSVAVNAMLVSLLCKLSPKDLKLVLIDPKRLELAAYADIPHLFFPIVTEPKKAAPVLKWVVKEMEERYEKMAKTGARNVFDYRLICEKENKQDEMPFIVVVIDELADLMMCVGREIEDLIARIAQMARAAGIHLLVATQRPSVDVITGLIKVNFPSRVSFRVTSKVDSRTILDACGAEKLLGKGDMLFLDSNGSSLQRVHGAYVSNDEIFKLANFIRSQQKVQYLDLTEELAVENNILLEADDELYKEVLEFVSEMDEISISLLQRKFRIGYNRSARIMDMLEFEGQILPSDGGKMRKVLR
ncbi:MAG: translocase FtsK protein [candidate division TM6 bacterium GW2011_GWF2_32_72]|nr:MAG: translocase FtsK protein [candidate division TM6 bacterium GW2011_GWF2_32_72]